MTSLFWVIASLFLAQNSLFDCSGKHSERGRNTETTTQCGRSDGPSFANFPVFFPVSREFGAETGSHWTASSAIQSRLCFELPYVGNIRDISAHQRLKVSLQTVKSGLAAPSTRFLARCLRSQILNIQNAFGQTRFALNRDRFACLLSGGKRRPQRAGRLVCR